MNQWFAGCDNVKLFELHKNDAIISLTRVRNFARSSNKASHRAFPVYVAINVVNINGKQQSSN